MSEITVSCTPVHGSFETPRVVNVPADGEPVIFGRTNGSHEMKADNLLFTSRVVSRKHAELYINGNKVHTHNISF